MPILVYILIFTILGSLVSLIGGILLLYKESLSARISHYLTAFAAGALLGTAFFDLLPEALHEGEEHGVDIFLWTLIGFLTLFLLERSIHWFHHHSFTHTQDITKGKKSSIVSLLIFTDTVHNFIDGMVIALTFLVSIPLGIITTFAVAVHELPQEIGDFGILLRQGLQRKKILLVNVLSAVAAVLGALLAYSIGETILEFLPIALSITAGFFIYISASDLIPEIHYEEKRVVAAFETILLVIGVWVIAFLVSLFEH